MASFKVSPVTLRLLKNFASISSSVLLAEGKSQKTITSSKSVFAIAEFPDAWPKETGIFEIGKFLGALSLFSEPTIKFGDESMDIAQGASCVRYRYSDPSTILVAPNKVLPKDNPAISFKLSKDRLQQLNKTCALLELSSVAVVVEGNKVAVRASDVKNPASHAFELVIPDEDITTADREVMFERTIHFKTEHLTMLLDGDYEVRIAAWPYGYFKHESDPIAYYVVGQPV